MARKSGILGALGWKETRNHRWVDPVSHKVYGTQGALNKAARDKGAASYDEFLKQLHKAKAAREKFTTIPKGVKDLASKRAAEFISTYKDDFRKEKRRPLARMLESMGLRQPDADYDVGDSPAATKKKR